MTITDELPNYFLDYREHLTNDSRWSDRVNSGDGTWSGNIFDFYYKVIDRLTADVKKPFRLDSNLFPRATSQVAACRHLATAARVKYPAALQRCKFDTPLLAAGSLIAYR